MFLAAAALAVPAVSGLLEGREMPKSSTGGGRGWGWVGVGVGGGMLHRSIAEHAAFTLPHVPCSTCRHGASCRPLCQVVGLRCAGAAGCGGQLLCGAGLPLHLADQVGAAGCCWVLLGAGGCCSRGLPGRPHPQAPPSQAPPSLRPVRCAVLPALLRPAASPWPRL